MMTNNYIFRTILFSLFILFALTRIVGADGGPLSREAEQWKKELKRLVVLSRLIADKPSLLNKKPSTKQDDDFSAEPFGCGSAELSECVLSQIAIVLSLQSTGSGTIFDATQGAAVQISYSRAIDVWSDRDIENNWDILKKWTDAVGPAVLLVGAFMLSQEKNGTSSHAAATLIGSGAGLILVGNLGTLGQLYGGVNDTQRARVARKTINALQDIETSRQAYEGSQLIYGFLEAYSNKSKKLLNTMSALSKDAKDLITARPSPAGSKRLVELCDKTMATLSSFKETAGFAEDYANRLSDLYKKYQNEVSLSGDDEKFEEARQGVKKFSDKYNAVIVPFLQGVPEEIEAMQNIKAAVIANSIAEKQYF